MLSGFSFILVGSGAGMSDVAGLKYSGKRFVQI